jgi:hypothetical protein
MTSLTRMHQKVERISVLSVFHVNINVNDETCKYLIKWPTLIMF